MDDVSCHVAARFLTLATSLGLKQHVHIPTHASGHTLDLILTQESQPLHLSVRGSDRSVLSDHFSVLFSLDLPKPPRVKLTKTVRKWSSIDATAFNAAIDQRTAQPSASSLDDLAVSYFNDLQVLLDAHAPTTTITITQRDTSWYNAEIRHTQTACRRMERPWRRTGLTIDHERYKHQRNLLHQQREMAKRDYIQRKLGDATSSKDTFSILNQLLHRRPPSCLPDHDDKCQLANDFACYFSEKIDNIRLSIEDEVQQGPALPTPTYTGARMNEFTPVTTNDVERFLARSNKSCSLDPVPTWLLKKCPAIASAMRDVINQSLLEGSVPNSMKDALVTPILKKPGMDATAKSSYRPVSNLSLLSKILEKAVSSQIVAHCDVNALNCSVQSAYKKQHSTETALLKVHNDLLQAVDRSGGAILVLLDLSAAFDTIDHALLLSTLKDRFGIDETALQWFQSYLSDRHQYVVINGARSEPFRLKYGVPQGSVLGPQLFAMYTSPLAAVIQDLGIDLHTYADDTQLYLRFDPRLPSSIDHLREAITRCTSFIKIWMQRHFLKLNSDKTELIVITPPHLAAPALNGISICDAWVSAKDAVRDLGVMVDSRLKLSDQVKATCRVAYYQLYLIGRVRRYINQKAAKTLIHCCVTSRLDYCNSLLIGAAQYLLDQLQRVQNRAARLILGAGRFDHVTPLLRELHWLPVARRIQFKCLVLTFKCLSSAAPTYLIDLLTPYQPPRNLRSREQRLLQQPVHIMATYGGRSFACVGPSLWNSLPEHLRTCESLRTFKQQLKTHLFILAFN